MREFTKLDDALILHFLGWLSADIPELHSVGCSKLLDSWQRYKKEVMQHLASLSPDEH
jgi:hypothetical protein